MSKQKSKPVTKDEWLSSINSEELVESCRASTTKGKLRLFAAACFRRLAQFLPDDRQVAAISALEDYANEIPQGVFSRCRQALPDSRDSFDRRDIMLRSQPESLELAFPTTGQLIELG